MIDKSSLGNSTLIFSNQTLFTNAVVERTNIAPASPIPNITRGAGLLDSKLKPSKSAGFRLFEYDNPLVSVRNCDKIFHRDWKMIADSFNQLASQ